MLAAWLESDRRRGYPEAEANSPEPPRPRKESGVILGAMRSL